MIGILSLRTLFCRFDETFFLQSAEGRGRGVDLDFMSVDDKGLFLDIWFENFAGLALRERNVMTIHFAFAANFTDCHYFVSFTVLTTALNASGWLTASSASILRSIVTPFCFKPAMSWE